MDPGGPPVASRRRIDRLEMWQQLERLLHGRWIVAPADGDRPGFVARINGYAAGSTHGMFDVTVGADDGFRGAVSLSELDGRVWMLVPDSQSAQQEWKKLQ